MSQKVTPESAPEPEPQVAGKKHIAVERLAAGDTVTATAVAAGVARETVHRWLRHDAEFQASLNRTRGELADATERTLLVAAQQAADTLSQAVRTGDVRASLAVLRGLGFLCGKAPVVGSPESTVLAEERKLSEAERRRDMNVRRMLSVDLGL